MKDQRDCERGCKGRVIDKDRGRYCKHIEKKLPKLSGKSIKGIPSSPLLDNFGKPAEKPLSAEAVSTELRNYGIEPEIVEILMMRFVDRKRLTDIAKETGWLSVDSLSYHIKQALAKLRKAGFAFK